MRSIREDKGGQMIMINLLFLFMVIAITVAILPAMKSVLDIAKQSDNLNCAGFSYNGDPDHTLSYNSSLNTDSTACLAIALYLPYIILVVLIGGVSKLLYDRTVGGGQQVGGF